MDAKEWVTTVGGLSPGDLLKPTGPLPQNCASGARGGKGTPLLIASPILGTNVPALHCLLLATQRNQQAEDRDWALGGGDAENCLQTTGELRWAGGMQARASKHLPCPWIPKDAGKQDTSVPCPRAGFLHERERGLDISGLCVFLGFSGKLRESAPLLSSYRMSMSELPALHILTYSGSLWSL